MVNYIRAEFYKVFRRRYTWITLVVLLALEALMVAGWMFTNSHGNHVDFYTGAGMLCVMLALGFYATLLTCDMVFADQYKNGTMKTRCPLASRGHVSIWASFSCRWRCLCCLWR